MNIATQMTAIMTMTLTDTPAATAAPFPPDVIMSGFVEPIHKRLLQNIEQVKWNCISSCRVSYKHDVDLFLLLAVSTH